MGDCFSLESIADSSTSPGGSGEKSKRSSDEIDHGTVNPAPIVVTGFGTFDPVNDPADESNFSWRVVEKLSHTIDYQGRKICVIKGKPKEGNESNPEPVQVCYSYVKNKSFTDWLNSTNAQVYLHLGVSDPESKCNNNCISLVTKAKRDITFVGDYCNSPPSSKPREKLYPDLANLLPSSKDEKEEPDSLHTSFDLYTLHKELIQKFANNFFLEGCSTSPIPVDLSFQVSDDAGSFLCDYLYYKSLKFAISDERKYHNPNFPENVLLVHIPDTLYPPQVKVGEITCGKQQLENIKAVALAKVIEFIVQRLLAQIDAAASDDTVKQSTYL